MIGLQDCKMKTRIIFIVIAAASFLFAASGCSHTAKGEVVVIKKTKTYHTPECRKVKMANTVEMTKEKAKLDHDSPCPLCQPDKNIQ
jgi:hypothetical protein